LLRCRSCESCESRTYAFSRDEFSRLVQSCPVAAHQRNERASEFNGNQPMRLEKLKRSFYRRDAETVARDLVGTILVHRVGRLTRRARIVETEAYVGSHDLACHAAKGRTARTEVMFGDGGHAYVYLIYGMYDMLNIVTGVEGDAQAVLIRAAEPLDGWETNLSGPGKICREMKITVARDNGRDLLSDELYLMIDRDAAPPTIGRSRRVNVDYAQDWLHAELRFYDMHSRAVTKHPKKVGARRAGTTRGTSAAAKSDEEK
jgi:DNA-3-methyladenine glycosylase